MGWWPFGKEVVDSVGNAVEKTGKAFDDLFTSDEERAIAERAMLIIRQKPAEWAHALNLINAKSASLWNSGWRPGLGWVCVIAAFFYFVPQYVMATWIWAELCFEALDAARQSGTLATFVLPSYPMGDNGLWQLVMLLLGGGAIRSIDKAMGTAKH